MSRLKYTKRNDGYEISTIASPDNAYGKYETAIGLEELGEWRIAEGYDTEEKALKGHEKYSNMTEEEINHVDYIG